MKVFIAWSGERSEELAKTLSTWLKDVIQALEPFMSTESIRMGQNWRSKIAADLETTHAGILCLTPENLNNRWILFEAGALSKESDRMRVTPLLLGVGPNDVEEPLSQFQSALTTKDDVKALMHSLNELLPENRLSAEALDRAFDTFWPRLEFKIDELQRTTPTTPQPSTRTNESVLAEILELTRINAREISILSDRIDEIDTPSPEFNDFRKQRRWTNRQPMPTEDDARKFISAAKSIFGDRFISAGYSQSTGTNLELISPRQESDSSKIVDLMNSNGLVHLSTTYVDEERARERIDELRRSEAIHKSYEEAETDPPT